VRADLGICLDGDADRVILLDETGAEADGDQIMALLAERWAAEGRLKGGTLVATVMSNLGLERFLAGKGLSLHRTAVGDRYVVEAMREERLEPRRRTVGPYRDDRLRHHGRRSDGGACSSWPRWCAPASPRACWRAGSSRCRRC
jgi:hypothetical protein